MGGGPGTSGQVGQGQRYTVERPPHGAAVDPFPSLPDNLEVHEPTPRTERLRKLLATEIARIVMDLELRRPFLMDVWGLHRDRAPFIETLFTRYRTLGAPDLAELEIEEAAVVDRFYSNLHEFKLYLSFTQDMPSTLHDKYARILDRLDALGTRAIDVLGGEPILDEHEDDPGAHSGLLDDVTLLEPEADA